MSTKNYDTYNQDDRDYHQIVNASAAQDFLDEFKNDNDPNRRTLDEEKADEDEDEDELEEDSSDDDDIDQKDKSDI